MKAGEDQYLRFQAVFWQGFAAANAAVTLAGAFSWHPLQFFCLSDGFKAADCTSLLTGPDGRKLSSSSSILPVQTSHPHQVPEAPAGASVHPGLRDETLAFIPAPSTPTGTRSPQHRLDRWL